jgi:hypothetical protein
MSNRPVSIGRLGAVVGALALALAACGGAAAPTTTPGANATPPPASSGPIVLPSVDIPSFQPDVDLEAQLPAEFCGQATQKFSITGAEFVANDEALAGVVAALGRSASDVSVAGAGVAGPECAGINLIAFRVKGADGARFEELFINAQEADTGARPTRANVGGKDVWVVIDSGGTTSYIYFRVDTVFGVTAESQADAAKGLAVMP